MFDKVKSLFSRSTDVYENEVMYHKNGQIMYEGTVKGSNFHGMGKYYSEEASFVMKVVFQMDFPMVKVLATKRMAVFTLVNFSKGNVPVSVN